MRLIALVLVAALPAEAQEECLALPAVQVSCADPAMVTGAPPQCFCGGVDVALELSCGTHFGCADPSHVGVGEWPDCGCVAPDAPPGEHVGESFPGPMIDPTLGGVAVCGDFYECPRGAHMVTVDGRCGCQAQLEMLPPPG